MADSNAARMTVSEQSAQQSNGVSNGIGGIKGNSSQNGHVPKFEYLTSQPENPYSRFISGQSIAIVPSFTLESGVTLTNVPVAYKSFGRLSPAGDNAMVICHALTGSADVSDWWGPLLGKAGKAFDVSRFFVICLNSLGSPYGSASPVTRKDDGSGEVYGPEFPLTTIRDDVNIFKTVLDDLGVKQIATVIGGSMGGALVLEFAYFGKDYVRSIIPIATSARYSAWGISWGEAQRQSIYSDPKYEDGYYAFSDPPSTGLAAARMSALLTYRSRNSFEARFGRNIPDPSRRQNINGPQHTSSPAARGRPEDEHWAIHNDGHKRTGTPRPSRGNSSASLSTAPATPAAAQTISVPDPEFTGTAETVATPPRLPLSSQQTSRPASSSSSSLATARDKKRTPTYFSAQSYLRYQGDKFIKRFDANCYIAITRKLDTHDVSRNREFSLLDEDENPLFAALAQIAQPTLILGIESDGLFTFAEQEELAAGIPHATLEKIDSSEGHDAFLLEFEQVNAHLIKFMGEVLPDIMGREPVEDEVDGVKAGGEEPKKSMVSEVDDITAW